MGWTFTDYRQPGMSHAEFFSKELLRSPDEGGTSRIIDSAYLPAEEGGVFYAAIATESTAGTEVWALIVLTQGRAGGRFGWKEMDETMGPAEDSCPARILDRLSETDNEHAVRWRESCRSRNAVIAATVGGAAIKFVADYLTPTGAYQRFVAVDPSKDLFRAPDGETYRLRGWRQSDFELMESES